MSAHSYTECFRFTSQALAPETFHVVRFRGSEGLNMLFSFTIELVSKQDSLDTDQLLDNPAEFVILREQGENAVFRGYPTRIEQGGHFGDYTYYTVELRPAFWKLSQLVQSAIFLDKNVQDVATDLLGSQPFFPIEREFRLMGTYPVPEFAMQYEESIYDYLLWRMEEQGAYFYFAPESDKVIFADTPQSHDAPTVTVYYSPTSNLEGERREEVLTSFTLAQTPLPHQVVVRCYDWKNPSQIIVGEATVAERGLGDVYLPNEAVESENDAQRLAKIRAEELRCRSRMYTGTGAVPVLRPGLVFTLERHYSQAFNRSYLVTAITHEGGQEAFITLGLGVPMQDAPDHLFYRNSFTCIDSDLPFRPARTAPRSKVTGLIRAFVDGASNTRAELDAYGRYKLLFPFDLSGRQQGRASCWVRMSQLSVGRDSGLSMPLLPGTEVTVSFIDGNPDRPVITGALANGETGAITSQVNRNFSGIRTPGGNQITINDTDKKQGISLLTADGLGMTMTAGSLNSTTNAADTSLNAIGAFSSDVAGVCKSVATGYKVSSTAIRDKHWFGVISVLGNMLGKAGTDTLNTLSASFTTDEGQQTKESSGLLWGAESAKLLGTIMSTLGDSLTPALTPGHGVSTYGVALTASDKASKSVIQVKPSKAQLISALVFWLTPRLVAMGTKIAAQGVKASAQAKKEHTIEGSEQAAKDAQKAADEAKKKAENNPTEENQKDALEAQQKADAAQSRLDEVRKELGESKDPYNYAKQAAARKASLSSVAELLPEIVSLVTLLLGKPNLGKKLGGVSLFSPDNNINLSAWTTISAHANHGIYWNTKEGIQQVAAGNQTWGIDGVFPACHGGLNPQSVWPWPSPDTTFIINETDLAYTKASCHYAQTAQHWISQAPDIQLRTATQNKNSIIIRDNGNDNGILAQSQEDAVIKLAVNSGDEGFNDTAPEKGILITKDKCIINNGENNTLMLDGKTKKVALSQENNKMIMSKNKVEITAGGGGKISCGSGIDLQPASGNAVNIDSIAIKKSHIKCQGVLQLEGSMIKIG